MGDIFGEDGKPLVFSTAVLLNPVDSTMEFYAVTNGQGHFEIKNIKKGKYLMQIAFLGFQTIYKELSVPLKKGNNLGAFVMKTTDVNLKEINVSGDYVPIRIKKDTIEFNANAFKTKPDAVVEDLLKKLPGIKVDRAGNIKAMGEDVTKLLVDGKEFFGNDPKVATKNLPANAIDKVQLYNKKSDESEFTGIDDGTRDKTINLVLKDDKKNALFGDITAGYGTDNHYKASAKAYRFTNKNQFAALGMINNINQFGFSFGDYLNFSGGISAMMHGGGSGQIRIISDDSFPINFGQPVTGLTASAAGGFNFSHSNGPNNRVFLSYLANGSDKILYRFTNTKNFTEIGAYLQVDTLEEMYKDMAHRLNFGLRKRIDSTGNIILNGGLAFTMSNTNSYKLSYRSVNDSPINTLDYKSINDLDKISGNISGSYMKKINRNRTVLKLAADVFLSNKLSKTQFDNTVWYSETGVEEHDDQYQNNQTDNINYSAVASLTQKLSKLLYLEPAIRIGNTIESIDRTQGLLMQNNEIIDSLSPDFKKSYQWLRPGISLKRNTEKTQFSLGLQMELGQLSTSLWDKNIIESTYWYVTPRLSYEYQYKPGRRINLSYNSRVNTPTANQLLPVVNNMNPLSLYYGNPELKPEYSHNLRIHWWVFDLFSFTSLLTSLSGNYTIDKINWTSVINSDLEQSSTLVNVDNDYELRGSIDFSTPIRKLGVKINLDFEESWNRGISFINGVENETTNLSHRISFNVENRKKKKWDLISGAGINLQNSWYSVQESLNKQYFDISWFAEIRYNPNDHWNFELSADVTNYTDLDFAESIKVPLMGAEVSYLFLKNKRAVFSINGFDLLNQNTGIERLSELNYLRVIQSNTIGRYVMFSFKYRLNKFGNSVGGIDIQIKRH